MSDLTIIDHICKTGEEKFDKGQEMHLLNAKLTQVSTKQDIESPTTVINPAKNFIDIPFFNKTKDRLKRKFEYLCDSNNQVSWCTSQTVLHDSSSLESVESAYNCSSEYICSTTLTSSSNYFNAESGINRVNTTQKINEIYSNGQAVANQELVYIVVDTSILLKYFARFKKLCHVIFEKFDKYCLFFPMCVLSDLDKISNKSYKHSFVDKSVLNARNFIHHLIKTKNPFCRIQTTAEVTQWAKKFSQYNDDCIIQCIHYLTKYLNVKTILLTDDIMLRVKVKFCKIHSFQSLYKLLVIKVGDLKQKFVMNNKKKKSSKQILQKKLITKSSVEIKSENKVLSEAKELMESILKQFILEKMNPSDIEKSTNNNFETLKDLLDFIIEHWNSNFSQYFNERDWRNFVFLQGISNTQAENLHTENCYLNIFTTIKNIFRSIKRKCPLHELPFEKIQHMQAECAKQFSTLKTNVNIAEVKASKCDVNIAEVKASKCDVNIAEVKASNCDVYKVFEYNLVIINSLCGLIFDFNEMPHAFLYTRPEILPEKSDLIEVMYKLYPGVIKFKSILFKIIKPVKYKLKNKFFIKFAVFLRTFVSSLHIEVETIDMTNFDEIVLANYCRDKDNQSMILNSYIKTEHFYSKLTEVVPKMLLDDL